MCRGAWARATIGQSPITRHPERLRSIEHPRIYSSTKCQVHAALLAFLARQTAPALLVMSSSGARPPRRDPRAWIPVQGPDRSTLCTYFGI